MERVGHLDRDQKKKNSKLLNIDWLSLITEGACPSSLETLKNLNP